MSLKFNFKQWQLLTYGVLHLSFGYDEPRKMAHSEVDSVVSNKHGFQCSNSATSLKQLRLRNPNLAKKVLQ